ncbi:N,N-dimethylformamidase beta subunit family domain-containing protein [Sphingomonas sp.]|jgi:hypothetical protein|uniref:N,N-dimethylformamidase beta subunit family domain-containing protein n=1 Tax=Sphingomonas sp. TaxID=28214 RepID=UPI0026226B42|nr:N,N-dimethylformamidase beta subunit family domain-containing protein [Sphingomonas sp.]MDF2495328.1 Cadherin [Sphingomonas sp.]
MSERIVQENLKTDGVAEKSYWDADSSNSIEGFAAEFSVNAGTTVDFKININAAIAGSSSYKVEIFRLGHYGGNGAREVAEIVNAQGTVQSEPLFDESRGLVDAGNWLVTDSWQVPSDAVSGVYLARLQRLDANGDAIGDATNQVPFVVRNDGVAADIVLQTSDTTWQAYNGWAGNNGKVGPNFYGDPANMVDHEPVADPGLGVQDRAYAVSYNRPLLTRDGGGAAAGAQDYLFGADYGAISWLEENGYDVSYISGVDTDRLGGDYLKNYKAFISVGHDEYWSGDQRLNVEAARDSGVNVLFWSGNEVYWKTRWETAISADGTEYRTLVCYKETWANGNPNAAPEDYANIDPSNVWTGTWRDVRFLAAQDENGNYIAGGTDPDPISGLYPNCHCAETTLTGQLFGPDGTGQFGGAIDVPASYGNLRFWRDTLASDGQQDISAGILGYEWDVAPDDINRPAGLIKLSETTLDWDAILVDQGNRTEPGTATHNLTLYRAESGALVFASGTVFWSWGLSDEHDSSPYEANIESTVIKQFSVNMFADMGIQPASLEPGLIRATPSADLTPASISIDDIAAIVNARAAVTITGNATDDDGDTTTSDGAVALVELSFDGGATWKVATGTTEWSYVWHPVSEGTYTVKARAVDDSLNVYNATSFEEMVTVAPAATAGGASLFDEQLVTATTFDDKKSIALGLRFSVAQAGAVTELRYYRSATDANDTDIRDGHLWRVSDGALLATATFTSTPGQSGWQFAALSSPTALTPGDQYVVSYQTADNYVSTNGFFNPENEVAFDGLDNDAFTGSGGIVSASQASATLGNGVYRYGDSGEMPGDTFGGSNYWVDLTFRPANGDGNSPPELTSGNFVVAENKLDVGFVTGRDSDGNAIVYAILPSADAELFQINSGTGALAFKSPPNFEAPGDVGGDNVYDIVVSATDGLSGPVTKEISVSVTDADESGGGSNSSTLFEQAPTAFVSGVADPTDYELGTKLMSTQAGSVTALRYYRGLSDADDTDARTLRIWDSTGNVLGAVAVTSLPNQTGWQTGLLTTPIALAQGETYIVSYSYVFNNGDGAVESYAATSNYFSAEHVGSDGVLVAPASLAPSGGSSNGIGNGLYSVGSQAAFPQQSFNSANYWVDVVFQRGEPVGDTNTSPTGAPTAVLEGGVEDLGYSITQVRLLEGFSDSDGDELKVTGLTTDRGTIVDNNDGTFTVTPAANYNGPVNLTYVVEDGNDGKINAIQSFNISAVNDDPTGVTIDVLPSGIEDQGYLVSQAALLRGFSDVDGDALTVHGLVADHGTVTNNGDGTFTVTPSPNYNGVVSLTYTVQDGVDGRANANQSFTVTAVNDLPSGNPSAVLVNGSEDVDYLVTEADLLAGLTDSDGDLLRVTSITADHGAILNNNNGSYTVVPAANYNGPVTLRYTVEDGQGGSIGPTQSLTLSAVNDAPNDLILSGGTIVENAAKGTVVGALTAFDVDVGESYQFSLTDTAKGRFAINAATGQITVANGALLDFESANSHQISVKVVDAGGKSYEESFAVQLTNAVESQTLTGSSSSDTLTAKSDDDYIVNGNSGNDTITTLGGRDVVRGGVGDDMISTGGGDDVITFYQAKEGFDRIDGGEGNDRINALAASTIIGLKSLAGVEVISANGYVGVEIRGSAIADALDFGSVNLIGITRIDGGAGDDIIDGSTGDDVIVGGTGNDRLSGGDGGDVFLVGGSAGTDTFNGGSGYDVIKAASANAVIGISNINGVESISGESFSGVTIVTTAGSDQLNLTGVAVSGVARINLGSGDDEFFGSNGADVVLGGTGDDRLNGGAGDDLFELASGQGSDTINGEAGFDTIKVTTAGATITWVNFSGIEAVTGSALKLSGTASDDTLDFSSIVLTGVSKIYAGQGNDTIFGSAGADVIGFSEGQDSLTGGAGADIFDLDLLIESRTGNLADTIADFTQGVDKISLKDVDASTKSSGDQAFSFIGSSVFSGKAGQLRFDHESNSTTSVYGDVNGDRIADFQIDMSNYLTLKASDFTL